MLDSIPDGTVKGEGRCLGWVWVWGRGGLCLSRQGRRLADGLTKSAGQYRVGNGTSMQPKAQSESATTRPEIRDLLQCQNSAIRLSTISVVTHFASDGCRCGCGAAGPRPRPEAGALAGRSGRAADMLLSCVRPQQSRSYPAAIRPESAADLGTPYFTKFRQKL